MGIIFDLQIYKITQDVSRSIIVLHQPELKRQPRTLHLEQFATYAKRIMYYQNGDTTWKLTSAHLMAKALEDCQYHVTQPCPYRTRVTVMQDKIFFIDLYFSCEISRSDDWKTRMQQVVHETLRNKGGVSQELYMQFYPRRPTSNPMPAVDWQALAQKPFADE